MNTARASGSCSACATRSAAMNAASPRSATITTSVGPARKSMEQSNATSFLAAVTYRFPGTNDLVHARNALRAIMPARRWHARRRRDKTRSRRAALPRPTFQAWASARPRESRALPPPAPESRSSAASKAADIVRPEHSSRPSPAAARVGRATCRRSFASTQRASAIRRSGGCWRLLVREQSVDRDSRPSKQRESPTAQPAAAARRRRPSHLRAYFTSARSPLRRTSATILRTCGSTASRRDARAASSRTRFSAALPASTRITSPPCSADTRRCRSPSPPSGAESSPTPGARR